MFENRHSIILYKEKNCSEEDASETGVDATFLFSRVYVGLDLVEHSSGFLSLDQNTGWKALWQILPVATNLCFPHTPKAGLDLYVFLCFVDCLFLQEDNIFEQNRELAIK